MKKFVNGFDNPRVLVIENGIIKTFDFSGNIQTLKEYYTEIGDIVKIVDGSKKKFVSHYDYEWILDYSAFAEADDLLKYKNIISANARGAQIILMPHKDLFWRSFPVHISEDKTEIFTAHDFGGKDNTYNQGFVITFVNANRISELQIADTNFIPAISAETYYEF